MEVHTQTVEETKDFGKEVAKHIAAGDVIALEGELGSGKTTFTQGFLEGLGITQRVTSPTFVLMKMYVSPQKMTIFHIDLYRLDAKDQIQSMGITDVLQEKNAVTIIEWAEKMADLLPKGVKRVQFTKISDAERNINADWL